MRVIPTCLAALLTAATGLGLVQAGSASATPDTTRTHQVRQGALAPAATTPFNVEVGKFEDGATVGWIKVAAGRTLTATLNSSGGYHATFIAYDANNNRLGASASLHPGSQDKHVWTNHTGNTVTVRVYADVAPHWVDVRLKGKLDA